MSSMFSQSKKSIIAVMLAIVTLAGGSYLFMIGDKTADQRQGSSQTGEQVDDGMVDGSTNQLEGVPVGDEGTMVDSRTGMSPDVFLKEFMTKLNEVNAYVYSNTFDSAIEIDAVYRELWAWAEGNDLRIRAVLSQAAIDAGNTEFQPQPAAFLELQTGDGMQYCAADVSLLDPSRGDEEILTQALMAGRCADFFSQVQPAE
jgi:hypothetical protein